MGGQFDYQGLLKCARYSFAPNQLHYCGPEEQANMRGYVANGISDQGLFEILNRFDTLYNYLVLIASYNHISNPFDPRVVEAYWLGNQLLTRVSKKKFAELLTDSLLLQKKMKLGKLSMLLNKLDDGLPHHAFHVLNIYIRTGHHQLAHTLETMDECRISWGEVMKITHVINGENQVVIKSPRLAYQKNRLVLGSPVLKTVRALAMPLNYGDLVSCHWSYICEKINRKKLRDLKYYTLQAISAANHPS